MLKVFTEHQLMIYVGGFSKGFGFEKHDSACLPELVFPTKTKSAHVKGLITIIGMLFIQGYLLENTSATLQNVERM